MSLSLKQRRLLRIAQVELLLKTPIPPKAKVYCDPHLPDGHKDYGRPYRGMVSIVDRERVLYTRGAK